MFHNSLKRISQSRRSELSYSRHRFGAHFFSSTSAKANFLQYIPSFMKWSSNTDYSQSPEMIAKNTGTPLELVKDPTLHVLHLRVGLLFDTLGVKEEQEKDFLSQYVISPGYMSSEWVWDSPPPVHTHIELPLIKINRFIYF